VTEGKSHSCHIHAAKHLAGGHLSETLALLAGNNNLVNDAAQSYQHILDFDGT